MENEWSKFLRHLQKRSVQYKIAILVAGISMVCAAHYSSPRSALASFGVAILASIFASFLLQIFPADALDSSAKAAGLEDVYTLSSARSEDAWFSDLGSASKQVDLMGRSLYKWINTGSKRKKFTEIFRNRIDKGVHFRILLMSKDNRFLSAFEEQGKPLHESMGPKLSAVEDFFETLIRSLPKDQKRQLQVRSNYSLPFYRSITRFDSTLFTVAYIDNRETGECPLLEIGGYGRPLFDLYSQMFEDSWKDSRHREIHGEGQKKGRQDSFEDHLIRHQHTEHLALMTSLMERATYRFHNFEEGWEYLFKHLNDLDPPANVLRDVTFASVARRGFKGYDFASYPARVAMRSRDYRFSVKVLVVVDLAEDDVACFRATEQYLYDFIRFTQPGGRASSLEELPALLEASANWLEFVVVPSVATRDLHFRNPFNIYGDVAVSRSIISEPNSSPMLEVTWNSRITQNRKNEFDSLWEKYRFTQERFIENAISHGSLDGSIIRQFDQSKSEL